jgi:hypothetical protein
MTARFVAAIAIVGTMASFFFVYGLTVGYSSCVAGASQILTKAVMRGQ